MSLCLAVSASCSARVGHYFILQARWVHFTETGCHPLLCLLQSTLLTIYTLEGEVHSVPLAYNFTQVWPLPRGLLLAVRHIAHFGLAPIAGCFCPHKLAWCLHMLLEAWNQPVLMCWTNGFSSKQYVFCHKQLSCNTTGAMQNW